MADLPKEQRLIAEKHAQGVVHTDDGLTPNQERLPVPSKALTDLEVMGGIIAQPGAVPTVTPDPDADPTWGFWNNMNLDQSILPFSRLPNADYVMLGMDVVFRGSGTFHVAGTSLSDSAGPGGDDFVTAGVLPDDLLYVVSGTGGSTGQIYRVFSVPGPVVVNIDPSKLAPSAGTVSDYYILRPNPVRLAALPGTGPLGQEQVFASVLPNGTRHAMSADADLSNDSSGGNAYVSAVPRTQEGPYTADGSISGVAAPATALAPYVGTFNSAGAYTFEDPRDVGRFIYLPDAFPFGYARITAVPGSPALACTIEAHNILLNNAGPLNWALTDSVDDLIHDAASLDFDNLNAARVFPLVSPADARRSFNLQVARATPSGFTPPSPLTGDRTDAFFDLEGASSMGFRAIFYPVKDDGGGNPIPDLANPILDANPLIDGNVARDEQQVYFDYSTGILRLSDPPLIGDGAGGPGSPVTDGAFNPNGIGPGDLSGNTTDRLPLYMVAFAWLGRRGAKNAEQLEWRNRGGLTQARVAYGDDFTDILNTGAWQFAPENASLKELRNYSAVKTPDNTVFQFTKGTEVLANEQTTEITLSISASYTLPTLTQLAVEVGDYMQISTGISEARYRIAELISDDTFKVLNHGVALPASFDAVFLRQTEGFRVKTDMNSLVGATEPPGHPSGRALLDRLVADIEWQVSNSPSSDPTPFSQDDKWIAPSVSVRNRLRDDDGNRKTFVDLDIRHRSNAGQESDVANGRDWMHISSNAMYLKYTNISQAGANALVLQIDASSGGDRIQDPDFGAKVGDFIHLLKLGGSPGTLTLVEGPFVVTALGPGSDEITVYRPTVDTFSTISDGIVVLERRDDSQRVPILRANQYGDVEFPGTQIIEQQQQLILHPAQMLADDTGTASFTFRAGPSLTSHPVWLTGAGDTLFVPLHFPYTPNVLSGSPPGGVTLNTIEVFDACTGGPSMNYNVALMRYPSNTGTTGQGTQVGATATPTALIHVGSTYGVSSVGASFGLPLAISTSEPWGLSLEHISGNTLNVFGVRVTFTPNRDRW
jgi:hypothetical protein